MAKYQSMRQEVLDGVRTFIRRERVTIEDALLRDQILSDIGLSTPSTAEDYSYCPTCNRVRWHEKCPACDEEDGNE